MASVWVPRQALGNGELPHVCVKTGQPADGVTAIRFRTLPAWTWLLLLFGILPFFVALYFAGDRVVGDVPVTRGVVARLLTVRRWAYGLAAGGVALIALGAAVEGAAVAAVGVAAMLASVAAMVWHGASWINARPDETGLLVKLSGVHEEFVRAAESEGVVPA